MTLTIDYPAGDANAYPAPDGLTPLIIDATGLQVDYQNFRDGTDPYTDYSGNDREGVLRLGGPRIEPTPNYIRTSGPFTAICALRMLGTSDDGYCVASLNAGVGVNFYIEASGSGPSAIAAQYNHSGGTNKIHVFGDPGITGDDWFLAALTWDGVDSTSGEVKAYFNGAQLGATHTLEGSLTTPPDGSSGTHRLLFLDGDFSGEWQWLSYYSRVLSDAEIQEDYLARKNRLRIAGIKI